MTKRHNDLYILLTDEAHGNAARECNASTGEECYDVAVIGAGLLGCFAARHLARAGLRTIVLEQAHDVCCGISKANSAIVYAGYDNKPNTLKSRMCVEGNRGFSELCKALGVTYRQCGSLMVACGPNGEKTLRNKLDQGLRNGVERLSLLTGDEARVLEPGLSDTITAALYAPSIGTVNPWEFCLAAARDAIDHGAEFVFNARVTQIQREDLSELSAINASQIASNLILASAVVNCAGLAASDCMGLVTEPSFIIKPTRGDYLVLDECVGDQLSHIIFHEPEIKGKGATLVPTVDGNVMVGPSEEPFDRDFDEPFATSIDGIAFNHSVALEVFPSLPLDMQIRSFSTLRP
ncbi:MAG: FAD-dependent oxidoreductase, partial [Coriobacteriia bacterium]|nr:FAD-dependent oxidoreductase [Coriobacteriia bacterium]